MASAVAEPEAKSLQDSELKQRLQRLRQTDNVTNLLYLARVYVFLTLVLAGAIVFCEHRASWGLAWAWNVPVFALAVVLVGAGQHQLTALAHEASHHTLLKHRWFNELISDWFCMFPVYSTTHHYRLQHLAHHQFVNDPQRDPNFAQLQVNGHWTHFPMAKPAFWREFLKQLWPGFLLQYLRATATHNSLPTDENPYVRPHGAASKTARVVGVAYVFSLLGAIVALVRVGNPVLFIAVPATLWLATMTFYLLIPAHWYLQTRIHPTYSLRTLTVMRLTYVTAVLTTVAWLSQPQLFGGRAFGYYMLLWVLPLATSFSFYMMMRQMVQHSNTDRGWLTNTRVYLVNKLVRDSVLPLGQDYHLPHHLFATVPHYRLKELHQLLMEYPEYRDQAVVVCGAVLPKDDFHPTIIDALGPAYAPETRHAAHIDNTVLDNLEVVERAAILRAAEMSIREERKAG